VIRELARDEVMELMEGPREDCADPDLLLHGKSVKDDATGWVLLSNAPGDPALTLAQDMYVCQSAIAMTDNLDIKNCSVLRKVDVGEVLKVIGKEEAKSDSMDITRLRFRAHRDGKEGYVTLKGNQGTVFLEKSTKHHVVGRQVALTTSSRKGAPVIRQLEVGEVFEACEKPKQGQDDVLMVLKARTLSDSLSGWVTYSKSSPPPLRPWQGEYVCRNTVSITVGQSTADADEVREAKPDEKFTAVEGPYLDKASGELRIRCRTEAEGVIGWVSLRAAIGITYLETL
jgi:hypothetical protein